MGRVYFCLAFTLHSTQTSKGHCHCSTHTVRVCNIYIYARFTLLSAELYEEWLLRKMRQFADSTGWLLLDTAAYRELKEAASVFQHHSLLAALHLLP